MLLVSVWCLYIQQYNIPGILVGNSPAGVERADLMVSPLTRPTSLSHWFSVENYWDRVEQNQSECVSLLFALSRN